MEKLGSVMQSPSNGVRSDAVQLSIVTTLYCSAAYIAEFYARATAAAKAITSDYEIVFVNDGSPDDSLQRALRLHAADPHVKIVDLARNFGHHNALMTGLRHASGKYVFLIDSDLEEEPELLTSFYETLQSTPDVDVVYGVQEKRKGGWFERAAGRLHYWILNSLWDVQLPDDIIVARLMTRRYVDSLIQYPETEIVISGLWQWTGFNQLPVTVRKHSHSPTTYNLRRKVSLMVRSITAFSIKPLLFVAGLGFIAFCLSLLSIVALIALALWRHTLPSGYPTIMISIWLLGGLIISCVGVLALYVAVIFRETKHRPLAIVRATYGIEERERSGVFNPNAS